MSVAGSPYINALTINVATVATPIIIATTITISVIVPCPVSLIFNAICIKMTFRLVGLKKWKGSILSSLFLYQGIPFQLGLIIEHYTYYLSSPFSSSIWSANLVSRYFCYLIPTCTTYRTEVPNNTLPQH
jgi:hypothetical protein